MQACDSNNAPVSLTINLQVELGQVTAIRMLDPRLPTQGSTPAVANSSL